MTTSRRAVLLVAISEYEDGLRFLQIKPDERVIDILRWMGGHYVPGASAEPGRVAGTGGVTTPQTPHAAQRAAPAEQLASTGWRPELCVLSAG